ncbi:leader peptidase (prepilin peptidase) / N-methyltransferase [Mesobacillus persicus]|uniref:Leader peptidase (Prepilin peptidase) / N-methyltransferase n=1 Tax=Mesobacillus persicus TaxID=930146 RepID=A0A1H7XJL0_9BACI|nr:A24 family peptidase [Mesobacillus persicus]SEM33209.1 leader peptidase (prepilin peptidase) / N-methyltransferase [Mesobacillus persicus]
MLSALFLYGVILGSFYIVVGLRIPAGKSIVYPGSSCPTCGHKLRAWELIPVLSYFLQKGKCRGCQSRISPIYPSIEFLTGVLFATAPLVVGWNYELIIALTLISLFIIIFVSDLAYMIIPDKVLLFFAGLFLLERIFIPLTPWWDSLLGAAIGFVLLLVITLISKGGMGGGDIKLFAVIGFVAGTKTLLLSFFFSTLLGAVVGLILMAIGVVKKGKPIPFGPFIAAGTLVAYYFGDTLISTYLNLFYS